MVDGRLQFLDVDMDCFYLDRENERPVGGDELARDHDLVRRELNYGPVAGSYRPSDELAALFGADDTRFTSDVRGHTMDYTLRPGERVVFRWDHIGKYAAQDSAHAHRPPYFGNSRFEYSPRLRAAALAADAISSGGWQDDPDGPGLRAAAPGAHVEYGVAVPWLVCGGTLTLSDRARRRGGAMRRGDRDRRGARASAWRTVWESEGPGTVRAARAPGRLAGRALRPARVRLPGARVGFHGRDPCSRSWRSSPTSWPRRCRCRGCRWATTTWRGPTIHPARGASPSRSAGARPTPCPCCRRHRRRCCRSPAQPWPPTASSTPGPRCPGARRYRLQVSLRPDFAWPYRPRPRRRHPGAGLDRAVRRHLQPGRHLLLARALHGRARRLGSRGATPGPSPGMARGCRSTFARPRRTGG
jgi:hypothetical protein